MDRRFQREILALELIIVAQLHHHAQWGSRYESIIIVFIFEFIWVLFTSFLLLFMKNDSWKPNTCVFVWFDKREWFFHISYLQLTLLILNSIVYILIKYINLIYYYLCYYMNVKEKQWCQNILFSFKKTTVKR